MALGGPLGKSIGSPLGAALGSTGTAAASAVLTFTILAVGAGASGGIGDNATNRIGGGGGAGGVVQTTITGLLSSTAYTITVGVGGAAIPGTASTNGNSGGDTIGFGIIAKGGGAGGGQGQTAGSGGSGGGCAANGGSPGSGIQMQGYGSVSGDGNSGSTGGSYGGLGIKAASPAAGLISSITGTATTYAVGGGLSTGNQSAATANTGNGGNGTNYTYNSGAGADGIFVISYPGSPRATGGTITSVNGNTVHNFTSSGTFTTQTLPK